MKEPVVTLSINDPLGRTSQANSAAASQAQAAFGAELLIVKDSAPTVAPASTRPSPRPPATAPSSSRPARSR